MFALLVFVLLCSFYTSWNIGANDVANAVGPSVGSGVLTLRQAVLVAAVFEFLGALLLGNRVAGTIESSIVSVSDPIIASTDYILGMTAALLATGVWLQLASFFGWPVSTTHSIVGAVVGFGLVLGNGTVIYWESVGVIAISWILSPLVGGVIAYMVFSFIRKNILYKNDPVAAMIRVAPFLAGLVIVILGVIVTLGGVVTSFIPLLWALVIVAACGLMAYGCMFAYVHTQYCVSISDMPKPGTLLYRLKACGGNYGRKYLIVERIFAYLQIIIACFMAFAHGSNDVANAIAPVAGVLRQAYPSVYSSQTLIGLMAFGGVGLIFGLAIWGWRVIETVGCKITELTPSRGFSVGLGAAITIAVASAIGLPISTTHVVVGAVLGIGLARGIQAINLNIIKDIVMSWFITLPAGAILSILFFFALRALFH
ncbi:phosphate transporter family protein [Chlamydia ibidis]|uniref:Phosphate transporter n=2 Tax=Chlamydia ibidis TaxID=1405396 RepID=S7KF96_9CHLA|nr:inorganic phosphate transporter [Chlamydia ibidis]EPP34841.1 phosphate transporter family protein [Chlamydia ibidis]EQM63123.1 phosphate transporter family protein [Chlamydia ibidis 10-1398/6]